MQPPTREELIAGLEDAELVLRPGEQWHYSNLVFALLGEIVMRVGGEPYADVLQRRILDPLGLSRTSLRPAAPKASPYYVDPYTDAVHDEPDPEVTESTGAAGLAVVDGGRSRPLGDVPRRRGRRRAAEGDRSTGWPACRRWSTRTRWSVGWGLGLELYRRGDRVLVGHGGAMPGFLAGLVVQRGERTGAAVLTNTGAEAAPGGARARPRRRRARRAAAHADALGARRARRRPSSTASSGRGGRRATEIVLSLRERPVPGRARRRRRRAAASPGSSPTAPTAGASSRGASAASSCGPCATSDGAVTKLYFATYPLTRAPSTFG